MRADVGTADKAMIRRVVLALACSAFALSPDEISAESHAGPTEVREALDELVSVGLVVTDQTSFALNADLNKVNVWAEASGDQAFANRNKPSARSFNRWLETPGETSETLKYLATALNKSSLSETESSGLVGAVIFKISRDAYYLDPDGSIPFPGVRRPRGPIFEKREYRHVIFALADQRTALTATEVINLIPYAADESTLLRMTQLGILEVQLVRGRRLYALSPRLGGAHFFGESIGSTAFERREVEGGPILIDNGDPSVPLTIPPYAYRLANEGHISQDFIVALESAMQKDFTQFREKLHDRSTNSEPRASRIRSLIGLISRVIPLPPPPRKVLYDVFVEDVREAEAFLDSVFLEVGPPPGWNPTSAGGDLSAR
ncbi:hypothetical protein [Actinoplanes sp. NPDC049265]|uniref:hypothetical protein n=1 Tax=Actinoplanes sp. NPDC049265 TaxID=3363902 RepID=UPI003716FA29